MVTQYNYNEASLDLLWSKGLNAAVIAVEWGRAELEHFRACERNAYTVSQPTGLLFWLCKSCYLLPPMERLQPAEAASPH